MDGVVEENSDDTWEDPRGRGRRGRGGRDMGRRGPPGQQEEEKEFAVSLLASLHPVDPAQSSVDEVALSLKSTPFC